MLFIKYCDKFSSFAKKDKHGMMMQIRFETDIH